MSRPSRVSWMSLSILFTICLYLFLCTMHYARGRPLWNDEQAVFESIAVFQSLDFFTKELQAIQVFPRLYLFCIQKISQLFDFSVWGLRLLPFISMISAFGVWLAIARRELKTSLSFLLFCLCWCASVPLIYYSAELKQYSFDVLAAGLFTLFLIYQKEWSSDPKQQKRYYAALIGLPVLALFSYPAFMFFIFPIYNLIRGPSFSSKRKLFVYGTMGAAALAALYFFDLQASRLTRSAAGEGYGSYFVSFASVGEFSKTWSEGTINLFSRWFVEQPRIWKKISLVLLIPGIIYMPWAFVRKVKGRLQCFDSVDTIAFVVYLELFLLGALKMYPFSVPRTSLFFCPMVFLMTIKGMDGLSIWSPRIQRIVQMSFLLILLFFSAGITQVVLTEPLGQIQPIWQHP